jgi:hypothetical protein
MAIDEAEIRPNSTAAVVIPEHISYEKCCLFGDNTVSKCGPTTHCEFYKLMNSYVSICCYQLDHNAWSRKCVTFAKLSDFDIRSYLKQNGIISKKEDDKNIMNEKNLIANRLLRKNILVDDSMRVCPKHRSSFGIDWFNKNTKCHHPDHDSNNSVPIKDCRRAKLITCLQIEGFPIGGR